MSATQKTKDADCPHSSVLLDYILGRLNPPVLDECEAHIADCDQCHETLRSLDPSDTLSEKVAEVISSYEGSDLERATETPDESQHRIGRLIGRLTSREFVLANGAQNLSRHGMTPAESELLADRAAEVLRYVKEETSDTEGALGRLGDYRLLHLIGAGSTGVVFQAQDISLDRLVALKVLRPSLGELARQRFLAEARSAASIEHANVVTIFQVGQVDRLAFMAMQWQPGQTLESKLRAGERFDNDVTSQIIKQIAAGLEAAHQKQVVHRDIKPANIWLCENNDEVKILDFGLARIADDDPGLTATGMLAGTPNFMSPEQSRGLELDGRSDLFSLGCVMYQLLTSRLPFGAPTVLATLQSIQNDSPLVPQSIEPAVTDELSDLTMGLLEKQPANRPQTATQLIDMLEADRASWTAHVNRYEASRAPVESSVGIESKSNLKSAGVASWSSRLWQATALMLIGAAAWWWSPQIVRIATDQGEVVIETNDDAVEIQVFEDGELIRVVDTKTQQAFDLKSGNYTIKATSNDSAEGTFEVAPNSLVMKRGEQQIVRVSHSPSVADLQKFRPTGQGWAVANDNVPSGVTVATSEQISASKLSKRGDREKTRNGVIDKEFNINFELIKTEYDQARIDAVGKCTRFMRTDAQRRQMVELIRPLARQLESLPLHSTTRRGNKRVILGVLNKLPFQMALEFIEHEIEHGNQGSLDLCADWISGSGLNSQGGNLDTHLKKIKKCVPELCRMIAGNYDNPAIMGILNSLAGGFGQRDTERPEIHNAIVDEIAKQGVPALLKQKVLTGKPDFHISASPAIQVLLADDREVYQKIESDLFAKSTTPTQRQSIFNGFVFPRIPKSLFTERCQTVVRSLKHDLEGLPFDHWPKNEKWFRENLANHQRSGADPTVVKKIAEALDEMSLSRKKQQLASRLSQKGRAVTNDTASISGSPTEPIYQGKTFSQWLSTFTRDRDDQTRLTALSACVATAETDQQYQQTVPLFKQIIRAREARKIARREPIASLKPKDAYLNIVGHTLHTLPPNKSLNFISGEIKNGNRKSREFCSAWVKGQWLEFGERNPSSKERLQHLQKVEKAVPALCSLIAENLQEPGVIEVLNAILQSFDWLESKGSYWKAINETRKAILEKVASQGLPAELKQQLLNGTIDFRTDSLPTIRALLANDAEVLAGFERDFLNSQATPDHRWKILRHIDPTVDRSQSIHLLEEKCQTVVRFLKSDLGNLPVPINESTSDWLVRILIGLQDELKGQGSAELKAEIAAALAEAQSQAGETTSKKTDVATSTPVGKSKVKPLKYGGKTFDQWFEIAAYDRLIGTYSEALRACGKIATAEERIRLVKLVRKMLRERLQVQKTQMEQQSIFVQTINEVLNAFPPEQVVDFVIEEITDGTKDSRRMCALWIGNLKWKEGLISDSNHIEQQNELRNQSEKLLTAMAYSLDHPGVEDCMESLVGLMATDKISRPKKQDMSPIQKQFYEALVNGTPEFRMRYCGSAIPLLGYHQDVFARYANDVMNSQTAPASRLKIVLAMKRCKTGPVDDRAKLLLKIAKDALAGDERKLKIHDRGPNRKISLHANTLIRVPLFLIYQSVDNISEETKKQFLIPQLESMLAEVRSQLSTERFDDEQALGPSGSKTVKVPDIEYLIQILRGNADAKMPFGSIFLQAKQPNAGGVF